MVKGREQPLKREGEKYILSNISDINRGREIIIQAKKIVFYRNYCEPYLLYSIKI